MQCYDALHSNRCTCHSMNEWMNKWMCMEGGYAFTACVAERGSALHAAWDVHHPMHCSLHTAPWPLQDYKKPLRVTFIGPGGVAEEGVDQGGVSREFFQLLIHQLLSPDYGMFTPLEESRCLWFSPESTSLVEAAREERGGLARALSAASTPLATEFRAVGIVLGLAIYNGVLLDVRFPTVGEHP